MCPWTKIRSGSLENDGLMTDAVWASLRPLLPEVEEIDLSGCGEPLLHPRLEEWIGDAKKAGSKAGFLTNGTLLDQSRTKSLLNAGIDWIAFSIEGGTKETYERIRRSARFETFCKNVQGLTAARKGKAPRVLFNVVMMKENIADLDAVVRLAADLGVDHINFKHCDVVRGEQGKSRGLFAREVDREIRRHMKALKQARRLAKKLGLQTAAFSFTPDELPVCVQDPRFSFFVRYDGFMSPCINLGFGGPTVFLGEEVVMPTVHYGRLPADGLLDLWNSPSCRFYRDRFEERVQAHDAALPKTHFESSFIKLREAFDRARQAMPEAPDGCRTCHYLYDI
jgi:MoaA/NifB/PqqE/SkfB family radical SAM enzyme